MNRRTALLAAACIGLTPGWAARAAVSQDTASEGKIWHVRQGAEAGGDGRGWATAFSSLQDALAAAAKSDEIWVARGTYFPDSADVMKSFVMTEDVAIYGGFAGTETDRNQRDFGKNVTILSGDIGKGDRSKNTRTIVMGADRAILDGFTITGAYGVDKLRLHLVPADILKGDMIVGGGMRNFMTSPIVRNCIFKGNYASKGAAVYNVHKPDADQPCFINVDFTDNVAEFRGGAVSNDLGTMPRFFNCRFTGNRCAAKGGGMYNDFASSPMLFNVLFTDNEAQYAGALGNDGGSAPLLVNVTIRDNRATCGFGAGLYQGTGANNNPILVDCAVDDIYNWHEDIVAALGSDVPDGYTVPLASFLTISNLKGQIDATALTAPTGHFTGYDAALNGLTLPQSGIVKQLADVYVKNEGVITYEGEYTRPKITCQPVSARVIHVAPAASASAAPGGDGLSWATALTDLQAAINLASASKAALWVKAGSYHPPAQSGEIAAFILYDGLKLYGGFAGTETTLDERHSGGQTILSARAAKGDYRFPHVLYGANDVLLDGLTIRDGNATGFTYNGKGGGLLAYHAGKTYLPNGLEAYKAGRTLVSYSEAVGFKMTIQNCRFEHNHALEGGAIYSFGEAALTVTNTAFTDNSATCGGAVLDREGVTSRYETSSFIGNRATRDGGAAYADYGAHVTFTNSIFRGNAARGNGGALYLISRASQLGATTATVKQSIFAANEAMRGANIYDLDGCPLTIDESQCPASSIYNPQAATS